MLRIENIHRLLRTASIQMLMTCSTRVLISLWFVILIAGCAQQNAPAQIEVLDKFFGTNGLPPACLVLARRTEDVWAFGTAFPVGERTAVTAAHTLHESREIIVVTNDVDCSATIVECADDWAVLQLETGAPCFQEYFSLCMHAHHALRLLDEVAIVVTFDFSQRNAEKSRPLKPLDLLANRRILRSGRVMGIHEFGAEELYFIRMISEKGTSGSPVMVPNVCGDGVCGLVVQSTRKVADSNGPCFVGIQPIVPELIRAIEHSERD